MDNNGQWVFVTHTELMKLIKSRDLWKDEETIYRRIIQSHNSHNSHNSIYRIFIRR